MYKLKDTMAERQLNYHKAPGLLFRSDHQLYSVGIVTSYTSPEDAKSDTDIRTKTTEFVRATGLILPVD